MPDDKLQKSDQSIIRAKLEGTLQAGSLAQLVAERKAERETFLLLDYSSSMDDTIGGYGSTRKIDALRKIATDLKEQISCPQVGFGGYSQDRYHSESGVKFIDRVPEPTGGTPLTEGIDFCARNGAKHLIIVSDGAPNNQETALASAKAFKGPIDVFYVGPEGDAGAAFLAELAKLSHGRYGHATLAKPKELTQAIRGLLTSGG